MRALGFTCLVLGLSGCHVEGHSHFLADGKPERFPSMEACVTHAQWRFTDGGARYAGFTCQQLAFGRLTETRRFWDGKPD